MKRHRGLAQLSREHHSALVLSKRARNVGTATPDEVIRLVAEIEQAFACDLEPHFQIEESLLLPALLAAGQAAAVRRTLVEHAGLRTLAGTLHAGKVGDLQRFGEALAAHVRFEERELFALAELVLSADVLEAVVAGHGPDPAAGDNLSYGAHS